MRKKGIGEKIKYMVILLLLAGWLGAYLLLPRMTPLDGPFNAEPFGFDVTGLPFLSRTNLSLLDFDLFVLESRQNMGPAPGTVFVLMDRNGKILWTRLGAPELGRIRLEEQSAEWFLPGGWVVSLKPEYTGRGEMYVSPLGNFRFFFHRW